MPREETSIHRTQNDKTPSTEAAALIARIDDALNRTLALESNLPEEVLLLPGMSGRKYRRFINNLVGSEAGTRYLEIGSWAGSTACAAMHGNTATVTCIDNWSQFGGPKDAFFASTTRSRSDKITFCFIESDFRKVDYLALGKFNIYLFDGPHSYQDQYDGIKIAQPALDDLYIQIVDDWNWKDVRKATFNAFRDYGAKIVYSLEIRTTQDDSHPEKSRNEASEWHNGYFIGLIKRH